MPQATGAGTRRSRQSVYAVGVALIVVLVWLYRHNTGQPEKLGVVQGSTFGMKVIDGRVYELPAIAQVGPRQGAVIVSQSVVDGGQKRSVTMLPTSREANPPQTRFLGIRGAFAYYLRDLAASNSGGAPSGPEVLIYGIRPGRIVPGYGPDLSSLGNPPANGRWTKGISSEAPSMPKPAYERLSPLQSLFRIPLQGGAPQTVGLVRAGVVTENSYFWLGVDADVAASGKPAPAGPARGTCRLMETSLAYGLTRRVEAGPILAKELVAGAREVYWSTPNPRSYPRTDLHAAREGTFVATVLPDMPAKLLDNLLLLPVAFDNRVFWREDPDVTPNQPAAGQSRLMSAAPDGSDRRTVAETTVFFMAAYRGSLYVIVQEGGSPTGRMVLKRLRPGGAAVLETVCDLPSAAFEYQFDGDYLYFVQTDTQQSLTDRLFHEQQATTSVTRRRRVRLPK